MIIVNLFIFISSYNITAVNIQNFIINPINGFSQNIMTFANNNIIVVILSICIFELFTRIKMPNIKAINYIASGTFMVYLIHDNNFFYSLWGMIDWITILYNNPLKFIVVLFLIGLLTFIFGILIYILYDLTTKLCLKYKSLFLKK